MSWTRSSVLTRDWKEDFTRSGCFERNSVMAAGFLGMAAWREEWNGNVIVS